MSVLVRSHQQVSPGEPLMTLDGQQRADPDRRGAARRLADLAEGAIEYDHHDCRHRLAELRRMLMGYDVSPEDLHGSDDG